MIIGWHVNEVPLSLLLNFSTSAFPFLLYQIMIAVWPLRGSCVLPISAARGQKLLRKNLPETRWVCSLCCSNHNTRHASWTLTFYNWHPSWYVALSGLPPFARLMRWSTSMNYTWQRVCIWVSVCASSYQTSHGGWRGRSQLFPNGNTCLLSWQPWGHVTRRGGWEAAGLAGSRHTERRCDCFWFFTLFFSSCLFSVKYPGFISAGWTEQRPKKKKVLLSLMDFAVIRITSISIQSRPGFLCFFLAHSNAFSQYTIFITGYWPLQSSGYDRKLYFFWKTKSGWAL